MRHNQNPRIPTWLFVILVPIGLFPIAIGGLWLFMGVTAVRLHTDETAVPAVSDAEPSPRWVDAARQSRERILAEMTAQNLPGVSVAVGHGEEIVWAEGFGYADLKTSTSVSPHHRFRIGTASTMLSSAGVGLLLEDGRLKLDEAIQILVPTFPKKQWPVTVRQLMGHTAGIISDGGDESPLYAKHCEQPLEALPAFAQQPLLFEPGTQYRQSNYGWILISAAAEAAANRPFPRFMSESVFAPLGMESTVPDTGSIEEGEDFPLVNLVRELIFDPEVTRPSTPSAAGAPAPYQVTSYFPRFAADPNYGLHVMRPLDYSCYSGASMFVSTASDLVRFGMTMHNGKLLKPATVEQLQRSQTLRSGEETGYGLGWYQKTANLAGRSTRVVGQDGYVLGGMVATLLVAPEEKLVVAVTSNLPYTDTYVLALKIAENFSTPVGDAKPR